MFPKISSYLHRLQDLIIFVILNLIFKNILSYDLQSISHKIILILQLLILSLEKLKN